MDVTAISTQQLRNELPQIREGLKAGKRYLLIHRSEPIGEILPLTKSEKMTQFVRFLSHPPKSLMFKSKLSSVELIRRERR
jgi:antitoxin (DNA-binding transcriptional repressor) of toxin-antitoxin stability system